MDDGKALLEKFGHEAKTHDIELKTDLINLYARPINISSICIYVL